MGVFSGHKTGFCGKDPFIIIIIIEYSLLDLFTTIL